MITVIMKSAAFFIIYCNKLFRYMDCCTKKEVKKKNQAPVYEQKIIVNKKVRSERKYS